MNYAPDFNYSQFTANTELTLANVPWNSDYRDIVRFANRAALDAYIDGLAPGVATIANTTYAALSAPVRIAAPFGEIMKYNYMRARNPGMAPGHGAESYYYFINDVRYVAPNTTEVVLQLDVWQSFGHGVTLGRSYVERGHVGIANESAFTRRGSTYLTVAEGMDLGGEYETAHVENHPIMQTRGISGGVGHDVMVVSTTKLHANTGKADNPRVEVATSGTIGGIPSGLSFYIFDGDGEGYALMSGWLKQYPWVAQGIVSVTLVPKVEHYFNNVVWGNVTFTDGTNDRHVDRVIVIAGGGDSAGRLGNLGSYNRPRMHAFSMLNNWRESAAILDNIPARYRHLRKFLTYPYMAIEMTTWTGAPVILKPELWSDNSASLGSRVAYTPPGQRASFWPRWYGYNYAGTSPDANTTGDDHGEFLNMAVHVDQFPTIPIVNDAAALQLANNARGLAHSYASAEWSQQRALRGADTSYRQSSSAIDAANRQTELSNQHNRQVTDYTNRHNMDMTGLNAMNSIAQGALQGGIAGPAGMAAGALGGAAGLPFAFASANMEAQRASNMTGMQAGHANRSSAVSAQHSAFVRDTNRDLAAYAANGDYANTIAGIDARVQDLQMTPPSTLGQHGGETANLYGDTMEVSLRWKMVNRGVIERIGEYWLRYGYAINSFVTPPTDLHCMSHFTYWKMAATYVHGAMMPEPFKQAIRGIFEKGVTVWRNANDIGQLDAGQNTVLSGVTYEGRS